MRGRGCRVTDSCAPGAAPLPEIAQSGSADDPQARRPVSSSDASQRPSDTCAYGMKFLFIDETGDEKFRTYLGFCLALTDARFYPSLKTSSRAILEAIQWEQGVEFKGAYLFSRTKGCSEVEVERRVEAAGRLLDLNAEQNARMSFAYGAMDWASHASDYLRAVPELIATWLPRAPKGAGKNLIAVVYDERADIEAREFSASVRAR